MQYQVVEKQSLLFLPPDPCVRKEWMNFIFNEVPDHIRKSVVLCSFHFAVDSFTNKAQFDVGFSERLKLKDDAVQAILDLTVTQVFFIIWSLFLCLLNRLFDMYFDCLSMYAF